GESNGGWGSRKGTRLFITCSASSSQNLSTGLVRMAAPSPRDRDWLVFHECKARGVEVRLALLEGAMAGAVEHHDVGVRDCCRHRLAELWPAQHILATRQHQRRRLDVLQQRPGVVGAAR